MCQIASEQIVLCVVRHDSHCPAEGFIRILVGFCEWLEYGCEKNLVMLENKLAIACLSVRE